MGLELLFVKVLKATSTFRHSAVAEYVSEKFLQEAHGRSLRLVAIPQLPLIPASDPRGSNTRRSFRKTTMVKLGRINSKDDISLRSQNLNTGRAYY